ncbi:hypothetical protein HMPREF2549_00825 [Staphylococcus sp. HMSC074D07]|nr:hypothetical protein HMPREF2549_00825 [Staphylococcus sp. HMSC074D07]
MEPVMDLNDGRGMGRDDVLKTHISISGDVGQLRMPLNPLGQCGRFPVGQEINRMMRDGIADQNAIPIPFSPGEIIDAHKRGFAEQASLFYESGAAVCHG